MKRFVKIVSMGKYVPKKIVNASELDKELGLKEGWTYKKTGVKNRHHVTTETASQMGAFAAKEALQKAGLTLADVDCIVSAGGTYEQPIPCTAALIQRELGEEARGIPSFDLNSTCLSFVVAFDTMSYLLEAKRYKRVLIVASDIASVGINPNQKESYVLFGDAAVAAIIEKTPQSETSGILSSRMETYGEGASFTEIRGGGTKLHGRHHSEETKEDFLFDMNGKKVFRLSSKLLPQFQKDLFSNTDLTIEDVDMVVPHQASGMAMRIMRQKLGVHEEKFMNIIEHYGNTIASSIPLTLCEGIEQGKIKRGDKVLLLGTSAGLSIGGVVFEY